MSISDKIAVMDHGKVMQVGDPVDIYFHPRNPFVADFIGQGTFIEGSVVDKDEYLLVELEEGLGRVRAVPSRRDVEIDVGDKVLVAIRPESFSISSNKASNRFRVKIYHISFLGNIKRVQAISNGKKFLIDVEPSASFNLDDEIDVYVPYDLTLAIKV